MDNMQNGGITSNFPWLSKEQIERLEQVTANLTGTAKIQAQQKLYQSALQQLKQNEVKDNRVKTENELYYKSMEEKDPKQQNYLQSNVRLEQLADLTKNKFWLKQDANTKDVLSGLMQYAQDQGVSLDSLNNYLDSWDESFLYDMGLKEQTPEEEPWFWSKVWQVWTDIVGGALASASSLPKMAVKGVAEWVGWAAKKLWADEEKVDYYVNDLENYLDDAANSKDIWADSESVAFNVTKGVGDLAQTMAWEQLIKGAVQGTTQGANLLNKIKNAPTWWKMLAWWVEWAWDMALYSIIADNKLPSREEEGIGAWLGALVPWLWAARKAGKKGLEKVAAKLELSWMLNPAKLNTIKNQLITEGVDLASAGMKKWGTAEDVWKWMIERDMQGTKEEIINKLWEHAKKSHALKKEVLGTSETLHNVESAKKSLKAMYNQVKKVPWLEEKAQRISELYSKDGLTLSELDEVKSLLDDTISIYTNAWDVRAWALKEWLDNVRKDLRKYIETEAEKEGLGNIRLLNNETQVSKSLQDAISRKDSADAAREMLSIFSKGTIWWALGGTAGWPFDWNSIPWKLGNILVGALAGQYLFSTAAKTKLAWLLNKMSWGSKKELSRLVNGEIKQVSKETEKEFQKVIEDLDLKQAKTSEFTSEEASKIAESDMDDFINEMNSTAPKTAEKELEFSKMSDDALYKVWEQESTPNEVKKEIEDILEKRAMNEIKRSAEMGEKSSQFWVKDEVEMVRRAHELQEMEQNLWKIWKSKLWAEAKKKKEMEFLKKKEAFIEEIGETYGIDKEQAYDKFLELWDAGVDAEKYTKRGGTKTRNDYDKEVSQKLKEQMEDREIRAWK